MRRDSAMLKKFSDGCIIDTKAEYLWLRVGETYNRPGVLYCVLYGARGGRRGDIFIPVDNARGY